MQHKIDRATNSEQLKVDRYRKVKKSEKSRRKRKETTQSRKLNLQA